MCTVSIFDKTTVNDTVDVHSTQYTSQYSNRTDVPLYMSTVVISTRTSTTFHTVIMHMPHTHTEGVPRQRDGDACRRKALERHAGRAQFTRTHDPGHLATQTLNSVALREQLTAGS